MIRQLMLIVGLVAVVGLVAGCFHDATGPGNGDQPPTDDVLEVNVTAPDQATVGQPFTATVTVSTTQSLPAISVRTDFDGLTLESQGDFMSVDGNVLQAALVQPAADAEQTLEFEASCSAAAEFAITAIVQSKDVSPVWHTVNVPCSE